MLGSWFGTVPGTLQQGLESFAYRNTSGRLGFAHIFHVVVGTFEFVSVSIHHI